MVPRICILQGQRWITSLLYRNLFMYFKLVLSWDWSIVLLEKTFQGFKMTTKPCHSGRALCISQKIIKKHCNYLD